jgi:hypothetical protein
MCETLKKKKNTESSIDEYMNCITFNCENKIPLIKKLEKINVDSVSILNIKNYNDIINHNYNLLQLKIIAKNYKLKISGNKNHLIIRIYSYLYFSSFIIKIQKNFRRMIVKIYKTLHGPATHNRKLCTNADDFITMEPIEEINFHQFISYKDKDEFIYGFDINSLHNLFLKSKNTDLLRNPYNRNSFPESVFNTIKHIAHLSKILKISINLKFGDDVQNVSNEKLIELRSLSLFQNIDSLGNYSNPQWFLSLNRIQLIKFVRDLYDIWNYRAQLSNEIKRDICPPSGDPFRNLSIPYIHNEPNMSNVRKVILEVLEKLVNSGADKESRTLGAYYVLGCLTLVNETASTSLPWLFESFVYF